MDNTADVAKAADTAVDVVTSPAPTVIKETAGTVGEAAAKADGAVGTVTNAGSEAVKNSGKTALPYAKSRPQYGKMQIEEVWENAKDPVTGKVYDPSGVEIVWDRTKARNGQWDMGHIPGEKYADMHRRYMNGEISKEAFLKWYRDPKNYRPELPSTNRSHKYE